MVRVLAQLHSVQHLRMLISQADTTLNAHEP